jgi:hypothetical protein
MTGSATVADTHPGGTGPTRLNAIMPDCPMLLPPVKLKSSCADVQLANVSVAVPTGADAGFGIVG